jgi:hypothetical protein
MNNNANPVDYFNALKFANFHLDSDSLLIPGCPAVWYLFFAVSLTCSATPAFLLLLAGDDKRAGARPWFAYPTSQM